MDLRSRRDGPDDAKISLPYEQNGRLKVALDWLKKKLDLCVYPHLLWSVKIERHDQRWATGSTCVDMRRGYPALAAVMDW